jgi:FkbM family methyltransferase
MSASNNISRPRLSWRHKLWVWYIRQPNHKMKLRVERWLASLLRLRRIVLPIPGPALLDLPVGEHLTYAVARDGCYEGITLNKVLELCRTAECFLDVGGQFGQYTLAVSAVLPAGSRVVTVEPNPQNYIELCRNLSLNQRTNVYPILAAGSDHEGFLRLVPNTTGNTGATLTHPDIHPGAMIVPAFPLGELLRRLNVSKVDVLKIDVEGFEPMILRGLFQPGTPKPRHIFFEYLPAVFDTCDETVALLQKEGYSIRQVDGEPFQNRQKTADDNLWAYLDEG